jgi:hypothetical protein
MSTEMSGMGRQANGVDAAGRPMVYVPVGGLSAGHTEKENTHA